jgi:hypothetical protein
MGEKRKSSAAPILAVLVIVLAMLGMYAGGYFWLGELTGIAHFPNVENPGPGYELRREYPLRWEAVSYQPLAAIETWLRGIKVTTGVSWPPPAPQSNPDRTYDVRQSSAQMD